VPEQSFRDAMARVPAGVVVVTARIGDEQRGLTASSLISVSLEPLLVAVALERESATRTAIVQSGQFNVSVLTRSQEFLADRFAGRAPAVDWRTVGHRLGRNGVPLLERCAAWLECRVADIHEAGDHDVCIGQVLVAEVGSGDPLILWDRAFWALH
jgi:flavin reductase (DIM6/NTAB) family NADH-FMN oxidoreductase RutF